MELDCCPGNKVGVFVCAHIGLAPYNPGQPSLGRNRGFLAVAGATMLCPAGFILLPLTKCVFLTGTASRGLYS